MICRLQGYINAGCPEDALAVHNEILSKGIKTDRFTYNTLLLACVKSERMDAAMQLYAEMKVSNVASLEPCRSWLVGATVQMPLASSMYLNTWYWFSQDEAQKIGSHYLFPDTVTYTTLIKVCFGTDSCSC